MTTTQTTLAQHLTSHFDTVLEVVAKEFDTTLLETLRNLPPGFATERAGEHFVDVLRSIATWGIVTTIVHTEDIIAEFVGEFPDGSMGRGFYNLKAETGLTGHLRPERCDKIVFLERPFMGLPTASVLFINREGGAMFKIFLRRNEARELAPEQLRAFRDLAERVK
ncbi:heme utilization cystosolic carrier protein HutX [Microvenator marinus]|jgi:hypothetical protein|uniref:Heme utilization cystosolic carrier protein HutX n=1 Tax=Microvenator marinus TaxID=2600177 RepID=A0A5B8XTS6_9DELT|nr:heme utilization cystosolic carrier protein HutX [Microvenator marinus]QED28517.1 heme utilization cystosolic carrier protein HutX [Microvenator marinus]